MARAITQIEQDMDDLEQEVTAIAHELAETYAEYLAVLGEAVQKQVVLTTYHLCTQGYPQQFLALAVSKRRELQQAIQALSKKVRQELTHPARTKRLAQPFFKETDGEEEAADENENDAMLRNLSAFVRRMLSEGEKVDGQDSRDSNDDILGRLSRHADNPDIDSSSKDGDRPPHRLETLIIPENLALDFLADARLISSDDDDDDDDDDEYQDADDDDDDDLQSFSVHVSFAHDTHDDADVMREDAEGDGDFEQAHRPNADGYRHGSDDVSHTESAHAELELMESEPSEHIPEMTPIRPTPNALVRRCEYLENQIRNLVRKATDQTNQLLQRSGMLPKKLPDAVLEAVLKAELSSNDAERSPNVLNLLVETSGDRHNPKLMKVMAVRLRVEELEFNNPTLTAWRSRIRELAAQLRTFDKHYRKLQREKSVAEAEATWRSTWYEGDD